MARNYNAKVRSAIKSVMTIKINKNTALGALLVALAFSENLKRMTTWVYPFFVLSILFVLYIMNILKGFGVKQALKIYKTYFYYVIIPYILIFIYSIIVICVKYQNNHFLSRCIGSISSCILTVIIAISLVFLYKEKTSDVICYGLLTNYLIRILIKLPEIGFIGFVQHLFDPLNTFQSVFEQHSIGFTINLLLIYYLLDQKGNNRGKIIIILIADYLILKRIAIVGLLFAFIIWIITDFLLKNKSDKKYFMVLFVLFILSLAYIVLICSYSNIYKIVMLKLGIYNRFLMSISFNNYFSLDIRFLGHGYGFVSSMMSGMDIAGASVEALHNDILKDYIELGFIGFIVTYFYLYVISLKRLFLKKSCRIKSCVVSIMSYTFVTMLTDNVVEYVAFTCTLFSILGVLYFYGEDKIRNNLGINNFDD